MADRLSSLDLSFLTLEAAGARMHLGAVLLLEPSADPDVAARRVAAVLRRRASGVLRLRARLSSTLSGAQWVSDADFDPAAHVHLGQLAAPGEREQLAARVGELLALPLHLGRPPWELHVLGGLADGSTAIVAKVHHALADGVRAVGLALDLFDSLDDVEPFDRPSLSVLSRPAAPPSARAVAGQLTQTVDALVRPARQLLAQRHRLGHLPRQTASAYERTQEAVGIAAAVGHGLLHRAPPSPLNVPVGPHRRFAMCRADLDDLHQVRKRQGGTVNDVVLTVVAAGLRSWLAQRGDAPAAPVRVLVPASRPRRDAADAAGNRLSGYLVDLPVHQADPLDRLHAVRQAMAANKAAGLTRGPGAFPLLADHLPAVMHRLTAPLVAPLTAATGARLFNTVITLVPIPDLQLRLAGARLTELYPVVPLAPGQGLGMAVSTFARTAHFGLHADHTAVPDLDGLGDYLVAGLRELLAC